MKRTPYDITNFSGMKEGMVIGGGLVVAGLLLQFTVGPVVWEMFAWPVNIVVLGVFVALIAGGYCLKSKVQFVRFSMTYAAAASAMGFAVALTIIMGVTKQSNAPSDEDPLGISNCLTFWPFVLEYIWIAWIVGLTAIDQLVRRITDNGQRTRDKGQGIMDNGQRAKAPIIQLAALSSHIGLFLVLVCGTLGSADLQRLRLYCEVGHVEWRALDQYNNVHELPLAIQLDSFILEEYPPEYVQGDGNTAGGINEMRMPRRFASEVHLYSEKGDKIQTVIEVNKPYSLMGWNIYQYSYDVEKGKWSDYSVFELVRDPWLPVVYTGIALIAAGAFGMFFGRGTRRYRLSGESCDAGKPEGKEAEHVG